MNNYFILSLVFFVVTIVSAKYKSRNRTYLLLNTTAVILYFLITVDNTFPQQFLNHVILPWDTAGVVVVVFEVNAHSLGFPCSTIPALHVRHVLKHCLVPPNARDDLVVIPLTIKVPVLQSRVPYPHHVMQTETRTRDILDSLMFLLHGREEKPPAVGEYSKRVLHYLATTGESVVEDTFFHGYVPMSKRLHHPNVRHVTVVVR